MPSIISYQKAHDATTTYQLALPEGATELCTINGTTYVALPDNAVLAQQPTQIAASVHAVTPDSTLRSAIIAASPHCQLIDERMRDKIRAAYDLETELKYARIGVGAAMGMYQPTTDEVDGMVAFGAHVEAARQWGREERAKLGL